MVTPRAILRSLLVAMLLLSGCASRLPVLDYTTLDDRVSPKVIEIWESHREVLVRAIKEQKFTIQEFESALRFFETTTGLPGHPQPTRYGLLPGNRLTEDLEAWDDWFRVNGVGLRAEDLT